MGAIAIQQMADRVSGLMEERLRIKGPTLARKLRRGGHCLPRQVHRQAYFLAKSAEMARDATAMAEVDNARVADAYDICVRHLNGVTVWTRRRRWLFDVVQNGIGIALATGIVTIVLLIAGGYL